MLSVVHRNRLISIYAVAIPLRFSCSHNCLHFLMKGRFNWNDSSNGFTVLSYRDHLTGLDPSQIFTKLIL